MKLQPPARSVKPVFVNEGRPVVRGGGKPAFHDEGRPVIGGPRPHGHHHGLGCTNGGGRPVVWPGDRFEG